MNMDKLTIDYGKNHYEEINKGLDMNKYAREMRQEFGEYLKTGGRILDLGCGSGHFLKVLEGAGYTDLYGVDADASQVKEAERLLERSRLRHMDAIDYLKGTQERFDTIFMID
jgi:2-polyprenyl-3-methyl-5-hydroxy-6-metoxy-1,4-benzoquinol methylase